MPATKRLAGVVGALGLAGCLVSVAAPARADECSGLMCLFKSSPSAGAQPAPPQPQPAAAPQTVQSAEPVADVGVADATPKARAKARPRPLPVVTIAAGPTEAARLKALAAIMPRPRVRIVEAKADAAADFTVTTAADGQGGARLFTEQLHIVAGPKVATLTDLRGKIVSLGADHSASQAAARRALKAQGIEVAETPLDVDNALDGLATGDLDAVVLLAPQPDARLAKLKGTSLHLVAWPQTATPPDGMTAATIDAAAYPGLAGSGDKVAALGVDAVLAPGPKARTQQAKAFLGALSQHSAALSKRGFDLIRADLEQRRGRRVANAEAR